MIIFAIVLIAVIALVVYFLGFAGKEKAKGNHPSEELSEHQ